ncbi:MAG: hypothetical protein LBI19_02685 [Oscillospiraceae bacterium]|jgi:hypothetical protein|nr:hypothetical protein [Oscillospiraceae bacterium]
MKKKDKQKDKHREKTGALFFLLAGTAVSVTVSALFAFAGFLYFIPYLSLSSAVLLTPVVCTVLYSLFLKKTRLEVLPARVLAAFASLLGAYVYICVMSGVLSGVFGAFPVEVTYMRDTELMTFITDAPVILRNTANYVLSPGMLWQDIAAWSREGWHILMAAAILTQVGLPQLFITKRPSRYMQP